MFDLIVRAGTVVDGTGSPPFTADVGVRNGRVAEVGRLSERGRREIDAAITWRVQSRQVSRRRHCALGKDPP